MNTLLRIALILVVALGFGLSGELVGKTAEQSSPCPEGLTPVPGTHACTHGPDPAPPGKDEDRAVRLIRQELAEDRTVEIPCIDDGQSGYRVQVLYVRDVAAASRYAETLPNIILWTSQVDEIVAQNALATGGVRHVRWLHGALCTPIVTEVALPAGSVLGFGPTITALQALGYTRPDRDYLMFADTTAAGICGIGTMSNDDRPTDDNWNHDGPSYARVDAGCWGAATALHEMSHNFGAVQDSAPNTSLGGHCTDEWDIMCYSDTPYHPAMRIICGDRAGDKTVLDCNHDDFFNAHPAPGSYLAGHWNTANSPFLTAVEAAPTPTPLPPTSTPSPPTPSPTAVPPTPTPVVTPTPPVKCRQLATKDQRRACRRRE